MSATLTGHTLYEIADLRDQLSPLLEETGGELTPELAVAIDAIEIAFNDKAQKVGLYIREQLATASAIKTEEERLAAKRKAHERAAESLKAYLLAQLQRMELPQVLGKLCTVKRSLNPMSVVELVATNEGALRNVAQYAPELVRIVPEVVSWDKKALLDGWKANTLPDDVKKMVAVTRTERLDLK